MADFPDKTNGLTQGESPSLYKPEWVDNTIEAKTEGGYEFRRPRTTRRRRKIISTGFVGLSHADYLVLEAFYEAKGHHVAFTYNDYMSNVVRTVRFDEFKPDYDGHGTNRIWSIKIKLTEF